MRFRLPSLPSVSGPREGAAAGMGETIKATFTGVKGYFTGRAAESLGETPG